MGLEQGFTLTRPPGKSNGRALTVEQGLASEAKAELDASGTALILKQRHGQAALRYTGLQARDATGRELRSWLEVKGERLLVRVEDWGGRAIRWW